MSIQKIIACDVDQVCADAETKVCIRCRASKSLNDFYLKHEGSSSYHSYCKPCSADVARERWQRKQLLKPGYAPKVEVEDGFKLCPNCKDIKPHAEYRSVKRTKDGCHVIRVYCKTCEPILRKAIIPTPETKQRRVENGRRLHLMKKFGITVEVYDGMLATQNGGCAICGTSKNGKFKFLHVDHCHTSGKVRGILCHFCNVGLGVFKDSVELLAAASQYIITTTNIPND